MKDLSECRILIVDDVKANVDVLVQALRGDYQLSVALNGEAALKSVKQTPPDLVLLDVMMPGLNGYDVCRRLRSEPETRELPVVFLTSLDEVASKVQGFQAGGNDYITKPFEILEVKARVSALLQARAFQEASREALNKELRIARQIQMGMIVNDFSPWREGPLDIHAMVEPAKQVGGDLCTVFPLDSRRSCLVLGDVSGKGIPAALFMTVTTTLVRALAREIGEPGEILARVNTELAASNSSSMFVTLFCAFLDAETGRMVCASGGHTAPVVMRPGQPARFAFGALGTVVGLLPLPPVAFKTAELAFEPGDTLLCYTDGVTEAFDPKEDLFGDERLIEHLSARPAESARATVESLLEAVRTHASGAPQSDDIGILAVRFRPRD